MSFSAFCGTKALASAFAFGSRQALGSILKLEGSHNQARCLGRRSAAGLHLLSAFSGLQSCQDCAASILFLLYPPSL